MATSHFDRALGMAMLIIFIWIVGIVCAYGKMLMNKIAGRENVWPTRPTDKCSSSSKRTECPHCHAEVAVAACNVGKLVQCLYCSGIFRMPEENPLAAPPPPPPVGFIPDVGCLCDGCGALLHIPAKYAGTKGKCNHCGGVVTVPSITRSLAAEPDSQQKTQYLERNQPRRNHRKPSDDVQSVIADERQSQTRQFSRHLLTYLGAIIGIVVIAVGALAATKATKRATGMKKASLEIAQIESARESERLAQEAYANFIRVSDVTLSPTAKHDDLMVSGTITNAGDRALDDVSLDITLHDRLGRLVDSSHGWTMSWKDEYDILMPGDSRRFTQYFMPDRKLDPEAFHPVVTLGYLQFAGAAEACEIDSGFTTNVDNIQTWRWQISAPDGKKLAVARLRNNSDRAIIMLKCRFYLIDRNYRVVDIQHCVMTATDTLLNPEEEGEIDCKLKGAPPFHDFIAKITHVYFTTAVPRS